MSKLKSVAYITILSIEQMKFKINHFLELNEFHRKCREEQYRRHRQNEEHMRQFFESIENK